MKSSSRQKSKQRKGAGGLSSPENGLEIKNAAYSSPFARPGGLFEMNVSPRSVHPSSLNHAHHLPSLMGPLHISVAAPGAGVGAGNGVYPTQTTASSAERAGASNNNRNEENTHSFIQNTWSQFSNLSDSHRNQLLKGLLSRSSSQQIEFICTCLNIKSLDNGTAGNPLPTKVFPEAVLGKYLVNARRKPENFHMKESHKASFSEQKEEESFKDAMKRAFSPESSSSSLASTIGNGEGMDSTANGYLNSNTYIKLLNSKMDPEALSKQFANASPEGLKFLTHYLSKQCAKFQTVLTSLMAISQQPDLERSAQKLFEVIMEVTGAKYGAIYYMATPGGPLKSYNNNWPSSRGSSVSEKQIIASDVTLKGDLINIYNLRGSEHYKSSYTQDYEGLDPACLLATPFFGDGLKVTGIIELINKKSGNPLFSVEDEFILKALASITTVIFNQLSVKQSVTKKSENLKTFFSATNALPVSNVEMGDLLGVIMNTARELVNAERCTIFLHDAETNELWSKLAHESSEIRIPSNSGLAGYVFQSGELCNTQDAYADPRFNTAVDVGSGFKTRTILSVPMYSLKNDVVGVMQAINKKPAGFVFDSDDMAQLQSFATLSTSTLQKSSDIADLSEMITQQRMHIYYLECVLESMHQSIVTIDGDGRANTIQNIGLLGMESMTEIMHSTSFEHWLGRENYAISEAISKVTLTGDSITIHNFPFHVNGRLKQSVTFHVARLAIADVKKAAPKTRPRAGTQSKRSSRLSRSSESSIAVIEPIEAPFGILLSIMPTTPNRFLMEQLGNQIHHSALTDLLKDQTKMDGEFQKVTTLVIDIRRFSAIVKVIQPAKITLMLNRYYEMITTIANKHKAVITNTRSDQAVICFGVPYVSEDDTTQAIDCALAIQSGVEELNRKSEEFGIPPILISIGVSTGVGITAAIGAKKLKKYVVMGAPVDDASEMQAIAKVYGANILIDEATKEIIKESYHIRELDIINKSQRSGLVLNEVMGSTDDGDANANAIHDKMTTMVSYELGLSEYRSKNWQAAIMHFKKSQTLTDDFPSKYMIERCRGLIDGRSTIEDDWDGSWTL